MCILFVIYIYIYLYTLTVLEKRWSRMFISTEVKATCLQMLHLDEHIVGLLHLHQKPVLNLRQVHTFTGIQRIRDQGLLLPCWSVCAVLFTLLYHLIEFLVAHYSVISC